MKPEQTVVEQMRAVRREVDRLRATHLLLQVELKWLQLNPKRNQVAIERFEQERDRVRVELRAASRKLIRLV